MRYTADGCPSRTRQRSLSAVARGWRLPTRPRCSSSAPPVRPDVPSQPTGDRSEQRSLVVGAEPRVWVLDSASLVTAADAGGVVVTGSHGGLVGGLPSRALKVPAAAAIFDVAGGGIDGAGYTTLPALDARGVAAATVASPSARIGDGLSTYEDGVPSAVNKTAASVGSG
jgi:hypothetical protein